MKKTTSTVISALLLFFCAVATTHAQQKATTQTQASTPDALVSALYKQHASKRSPFFQTRSRALLDKYFEKTLADLIWKDAVTSKGEVGAIDGDPLYDAQEMQIKNFAIHSPQYADGKATVSVTFTNLGKKQAITFLLVKQAEEWRIADIKYTDGRSLLKTLQESAGEG